jgi:hypothetical protein
MRAIALLTLFGIAFCGLAACSGNKASNAANNAAQTAASAAGAMGNAAQNAGSAAGAAAGAMGNAAKGAAQAAASGAGAAAGAMGSAANNAMSAMTKPNCGAVAPVWVNLNTKVYRVAGERGYGRGQHGEYLCPAQARAQGFRPANRRAANTTM